MSEPSLLDYIKSKINPKKYSFDESFMEEITNELEPVFQGEAKETEKPTKKKRTPGRYKYLSLLPALTLAVIGQVLLEPPDRSIWIAVVFYLFSTIIVIWSEMGSHSVLESQTPINPGKANFNLPKNKLLYLSGSFIFLVLAFFAFKPDKNNDINFNFFNLLLWISSLVFFLIAFLDFDEFQGIKNKLLKIWSKKELKIKITPWMILLFISIIFVFFFRFYRLNEVLGEMFSDHAEKLLDVNDILLGKYPVFFIRNTGREFLQFYWTVLILKIFKTGISFMSLKIGTAIAGFLTLPFIYLLGKELRNKWVGLFAFVLAGIGYWPNVNARVGLRFPFYALFAAPAIYFLIRAIRSGRKNDFIYSGIAVGLGLHGYSPFRILPILLIFIIVIFFLHKSSHKIRNQVINGFLLLIITSFIVFLPLFKFSLVNPEQVAYRSMTRLTSQEKEISEPIGKIFFENLWKAETMFFYSSGTTWVNSIPGRPALDVITAALFFLGNLLVIIQYLKYKNWEDVFLIISVPFLMLPSILSLAFPQENPSLNRANGAIIPVFIISAIGLERILTSAWKFSNSKRWRSTVIGISASIIAISSFINFDLVFNQFDKQYVSNAWNTSQIGDVIKGFSTSIGNYENAFVVPSPHWVDTRLVGINAGYPTKDYALWPDQFEVLNNIKDDRLVIIRPENKEAIDQLRTMFPDGNLYNYSSGRTGKDFLIYQIYAESGR